MVTINLSIEDAEKLQTVKAVIEKQYGSNFTHRELAQMVGTNESKLRVGFKQLHHKTIHEFQLEVRLNKAKELLENTALSLKLIAIQLGWDQSNMVKTFKKITGLTPIQYRVKNTRLRVFYINTKSKRVFEKTDLPINCSNSPLLPM